MNRRKFLKSLVGVVGAKALAPLVPPIAFAGVDLQDTVTITFPKPGLYPVEITESLWHFGSGVIYVNPRMNFKVTGFSE